MIKGRVTVIIPVFNRIDYLEETINSVVEQDYSDIELIVIDDGSTDGGFELLQEIQSQYEMVLLFHEGRINRGQSAAINLGLKQSTGEFIAILDSDDLFLPNKLSIQVKALEENPDVGLVYGRGKAIDSKGVFLYDMLDVSHIETNDPNKMLLDCYFLLPQNSLVRSAVYDEVGQFDEELRSGQDHDMLIRMAEVAKFLYISKYFFCYRRHENSISSKGQEIRWRSAFKILNKAKLRYHYERKTLRKRLAVINYRLARALILYKRKRFEAYLRLMCSGLLDPGRAFRVLLGLEKPY